MLEPRSSPRARSLTSFLCVLSALRGKNHEICAKKFKVYSGELPNGSQIAVQSIQSGKRMMMLVDFASGTVSPVTVGELVGWMANP